MSSNMERVAAMPDASLYVNRDGRRADDCVDSMVERFCPGEQKHKVYVASRVFVMLIASILANYALLPRREGLCVLMMADD